MQKPHFFLDANCVNARQGCLAMNALEELERCRLIELNYSETSQNEASKNSTRRAEKASEYPYIRLNSEWDRPEFRQQIERIVFPQGAQTPQMRNDIDLLHLAEMDGSPVVTLDGDSSSQTGGILGHAAELEDLGISVLRPTDALIHAIRQLGTERYGSLVPNGSQCELRRCRSALYCKGLPG
jgi:hypothetical protein